MQKIKTFGLVAFKKSAQVTAVVQRIAHWAQQKDIPLFFHPVLENQSNIAVSPNEPDFINSSDARGANTPYRPERAA